MRYFHFRNRTAPLLSVLSLFLLTVALDADTIQLRNGRKITGTVVNQTRTEIHIKSNGVVQKISKKEVLRVIYRTQEEEKRLEAEQKEQERKRAEEEKKRIEQEAAERKRKEELERKRIEEEKERVEREKRDEEKRLKREERERKRALKKEKIKKLASRRSFTPVISYGSARYMPYYQDETSQLSQFIGTATGGIGSPTNKWETRTSIPAVGFDYESNRYLLKFRFSLTTLSPGTNELFAGIESGKNSSGPSAIARASRIDYNLQTRSATVLPGYAVFLREHFETDLLVGYAYSTLAMQSLGLGNKLRSPMTIAAGVPEEISVLTDARDATILRGRDIGLLFRWKNDPLETELFVSQIARTGFLELHSNETNANITSGGGNYMALRFKSELQSTGYSISLSEKYRLWRGLLLRFGLDYASEKISATSTDLFFYRIEQKYDSVKMEWFTNLVGPDADPEMYMMLRYALQGELNRSLSGKERSTAATFGIEYRFDFNNG